MRTKTLYTRDAEKAGISRFPNFHRTGNITGMKQLYYEKTPYWYVAGVRFTTYRANPKFTTTWLIKWYSL